MNLDDKHYVIISAHQPENDRMTNAKLQADLFHDLIDLTGFDTQILPASGVYNGVEEESFAVLMPDDTNELFNKIQEGLLDLMFKYEQQCILLVFRDATCAFVCDEGEYTAHRWIEISENEYKGISALGEDGCTRILDRYFVADESEVLADPFEELIEQLKN